MLQNFCVYFLIFDPFTSSEKEEEKSCFISAVTWLKRLFFALAFFAIPVLSWVHAAMTFTSNGEEFGSTEEGQSIYLDNHMTLWFVFYWLVNLTYVFIGIYASIKVIGTTSESSDVPNKEV